ncbi:metal ABC transporter solute-binding protein, Zn/Mn family [Cellulomonas sp. ATA003]|uniref:metal ABC transporter substrate-binding protein n=1 Tax=Cellulomonas sp. ATA003 TaxID=3073064 RepID=UPI002872E5B2|nr:zinc ABC transporter substrate-binding protein [Cellulomonas sp. ATA003]WNB87642.1 zinc ABC transporter substrate-binding protein [Cellulomonas sp. ATA003]
MSPRQVRDIRDADVVVMLSGLQAATDEAVATGVRARVVDAVGAAADDPGAGTTAGAPDGPTDLHFWLDPTRLALVVDDVADALAEVDPDHAADYAAAAAELESDLTALDEAMAEGLAGCAGATVVSSHAAFGFLADRYGLQQVGITGVDPEVEPSPARLRGVRQVVEDNGVRRLFFEVLADPEVTRVLADDLGVATAVLDPLEGRTDPDRDYLDTMHANLEALRTGLSCQS